MGGDFVEVLLWAEVGKQEAGQAGAAESPGSQRGLWALAWEDAHGSAPGTWWGECLVSSAPAEHHGSALH